MQEIRLRALNELEERLRLEKLAEIEALMRQGETSLDQMTIRRVVEAMHRTATLFEDIGFVPTALGMMVRVEEDIYDQPLSDSVIFAVQTALARAMEITIGGRRARPF